MAPDELDPPPPLPQHGEPGQHGHDDGTGGDGGTGGRGGIGLTGDRGARGRAGAIGPIGPAGASGHTGASGPGTRQTKADRWALFVVTVLTALSAIYFSTQANSRLDDIEAARSTLTQQQAAFADQIDCEYGLLEQTLAALKARSVFGEQQARTALDGDRAQRLFLLSLASPPQGVPSDQLTLDYLAALDAKITATREQLEIRGLNPYPSDADVNRCHPPETSAP